MNNIKVDVLSIEDINTTGTTNEIMRYLDGIVEWMSQQSLKTFPWNNFKNKALILKNNIQYWVQTVQNELIDKKSLLRTKATSREKVVILNQTKNIFKLQAAITKGYIFIQSFRQFLTKESLEYLIMFDDYMNGTHRTQSIGRFTLKELLPTLIMRVTNDNSFQLQIGNCKILKDLNDRKSQIDDRITNIYQQIIDLTNELQEKRQHYLSEQRTKEKGLTRGGNVRSGFEIGQGGIAFEKAANLLTSAVYAGETDEIDIILKNFHADNAAFYKAGDMDKQHVEKIFQNAKNLALELKRVTLSENSYGARLTGAGTVQNALEGIIKDIESANGIQKRIFYNLSRRFTTKEKDANELFDRMCDECAIKAINKSLQP